MNIKSAKYSNFINIDGQEIKNASIIAIVDNERICVPVINENRHYQAIQEWAAKGNKIEDAD
tara:strand:+ start:1057 stop:1242 length:186 start_codon:yes stop_codon:yes gene_type:complete